VSPIAKPQNCSWPIGRILPGCNEDAIYPSISLKLFSVIEMRVVKTLVEVMVKQSAHALQLLCVLAMIYEGNKKLIRRLDTQT